MSDLRELYQEIIIDHSRRPHHFGTLTTANREALGFNPLCGDKLTLYLEIEKNIIKDIRFVGNGCAISTASASLMTDVIKGKSVPEAQAIFKRFHTLMTDKSAHIDIEKLAVLTGVREFPMRVKCATLAWHTLHSALENKHEVVTTE